MKKKKDSGFLRYIAGAAKVVERWPAWKRNLLGPERKSNESDKE
jgi:hypothetical protein